MYTTHTHLFMHRGSLLSTVLGSGFLSLTSPANPTQPDPGGKGRGWEGTLSSLLLCNKLASFSTQPVAFILGLGREASSLPPS